MQLPQALSLHKIHGHAGYLIDQFMSPDINKRTDEYGDLNGRLRIVKETMKSESG